MLKTLLVICCCLISLNLFAQNRIITGTVTAKDDSQPLIGASVLVQNTTKGASTDVDGNYSIELTPTENILVFSYLGYVPQTIILGESNVVNVVMLQDVTLLNDVVVVGYGTQKKSDLTGSVSSVRGDDLVKIPNSNPVQALQGKVAGVQVTSASGEPGSSPVVRVRGVGTFNNSSPIYVVDGVILDDISFLNSSDIESMEILKDASSTAIYGSRGANGVILVTTKQGKAGINQEPTITFGAEYSTQILGKKIDLLTGREFADYVNHITPGSYNNLDAVPNTDWQSLLFHNASLQNYDLAISGASEKSQYYVGLGYFNQKGIIDKSSYERFTLKLNNTYHLYKNFKLGNNITFAPYTQQNGPNVTYAAYRAQPIIEPYNADGSYAEVPGVGNPFADIENSNNYSRGLRTVGNIYGEVSFLNGFVFRSSFGVDMGYNEARSFTPAFYVSPQQQNEINDLNVGNSHNLNWLWENTLDYKKTIKKNSFDVLGGYTMQEATSEYLSASGQNIIGDTKNLWYLNPDNLVPTSISNGVNANNNFALVSFLARANYTYDSRYLLTATFRRDGSSKFLGDNRWGNFPSIAAGWNISNEEFLKNNSFISNLKLRASYGVIGNEKISYLDQYALVLNGMNAVFGNNEVLTPGSTYGKTGNPDLKWETTKQADVGLEIGVLKNRLTGEFDYYRRQTDDILVELSTPGFFGNGEGEKVRYNAGSVLNTGFEFNVAWNNTIGDFHYKVGVLGSTLHNEVLSVGGNSGVDSTLVGGELGNGQTVTLSSAGNPIGSFYGYEVDGVFQNQNELDSYPHESLAQPGDLKYVDQNGDGVLNSLDRVYLGSPIPTFIYGFSLEGSYKGFDLSMDFQGQSGNMIYNGKETVRPDLYNFESHVTGYWNGDGTSNYEPRATSGGVNFLPSEHYLQSGSFFRLRNITLAYSLPSKISNKLKMKETKIYLRGTNVFTSTKFTGYTPEIGNENVLSNGID
ncbi:MAG: TonB-dependent receptor, partial [Chitinophagales bacterium]|nr:TonB-dependent receptor [Chitinophagales bacterium]